MLDFFDNSKKLFFIFLGFILLYLVSETYLSIFIVSLTTLFTFIIAEIKCKVSQSQKFFIERFCVPTGFLILVLFNIFGLIKTLTGTVNYNQSTSLIFVGITFYILSAAAYIADLNESSNKKNLYDNFINLYLYLILPFKILSGPLEKPDIIKYFKNIIIYPKSTARKFVSFTWISLGIFMKFCISSRLEPSKLLNYADPLGSFICALIFELKFYFDFAGYSFLAYGFSKFFNFKLTLNFNHPFTANNVVEFWHRWHITLGKFLQKYILLKNIKFFKTRISKAVFASFIFVISAMWHGGTTNYLMWGIFHGAIYLTYVQYFKEVNFSKFTSLISMFFFFVFGRMIAIDINSGRLIEKFQNYFNFNQYLNYQLNDFINILDVGTSTMYVLVVSFLFIVLEFVQVKIYRKNHYRFFRKPLVSCLLFVISVFFGFNSMELLYARI